MTHDMINKGAPGALLALSSLGLMVGLQGCGGGGGDSGATPQSVKGADAHCSSLMAGPHRGVALSASNPGDPNSEYTLTLVETVDLSGPTPVVVGASGRSTLTPVAGEACHYTGDGLDLLVSSAGVVTFTRPNPSLPNAAKQVFLAFPEQADRPLSDLVGDWVGLRSMATRIDYTDTAAATSPAPARTDQRTAAAAMPAPGPTVTGIAYASTAASVRIGADGSLTLLDCLNGSLTAPMTSKTACTDAGAALGQLSRHTDGAWSLAANGAPGTAPRNWRVFAYRSSKGKMIVALNTLGEMMFLSPQVALPLPPLGYATHTADVVMLGALGTPVLGFYDSSYVVSQRLSGSVYTRTGSINGAPQVQTLTLNQPMTGLAWRTAQTGMVHALPLQGMGLTFAALPQFDGTTQFALSIDRSN